MLTLKDIKRNFLDDLPSETKEKLQPLHKAVIDEAIENILDGNCTIDERIPKDRYECFIAIAYSLVAGQAAPPGLFQGLTKQAEKNVNLSLTFRGQKYKYII
jgi:hypothetical protein